MTWVLLVFLISGGAGEEAHSIDFKTLQQCQQAQDALAEEMEAGTIPRVRSVCLEKD